MSVKKRLLDYDADTGVATYHEYDHHEKVTRIETVQDVAPYLEDNKARATHDVGGAMGLTDRSRRQIRKGWWHVASIPIGVQYAWLKLYGIDVHNKDHHDAVMKKLDDPEWAYLRTATGRLGKRIRHV